MSGLTCVVIAAVGERWMQAALPEELASLFTVRLVVPTATTVAGVGDELVGAAKAVGAEPVVLFGHSMNGALALAAAGAHPASVRGVIAVGAPPRLPPDQATSTTDWDLNASPARKQRFDELVAAHNATTDEAERERLRWKANALRQWHDMTFDPSELDVLIELDPAWPTAVFADGSTFDWTAALAAVHCPVLLAFGQDDFVCPPTMWTGEELPNADVTAHVFAQSAHNAYVEEPAAFMAVARSWVEEHVASAGG